MDTSIIILTLVFLAMFIVPFSVIALMNKHKNNPNKVQDDAENDETKVSSTGKSA